MNLRKTVLHCPNDEIYRKARKIFNNSIKIECSMNIEYLKCPVGDDKFVRNYLKGKLSELKRTT